MSWIVLIAGIALWWGAHLFKRIAPEARAAWGEEAGKGRIAIALFVSIILMVIGYRWTPFVPVWNPPTFFVHINNLLMIFAVYLMSPGPKKGAFFHGMRHPMLTGFGLFAFAHLLANGDLTAILTFGLLLAWSVAEIRVINAAEPDWTPNPKGAIRFDVLFLLASVILVLILGLIHNWLGPWPFGGTPPF